MEKPKNDLVLNQSIVDVKEVIPFMELAGSTMRVFTWQPYAGIWDPDNKRFAITKYMIVWISADQKKPPPTEPEKRKEASIIQLPNITK